MNEKLRNMTSTHLMKENKILLLYRQGGKVVDHVWTGSAGGHFEPFELNDPQACVLREMKEEIGIDANDIEELALRYITLRRVGTEIRQNYYYFANLKSDVDENIISNEGNCKWFYIDEINNLEMPYTTRFIIEHYFNLGRKTSEIYVGTANGEKVVFTKMPEY